MELNELKPAWQTFKAMQSLDLISDRQLDGIIGREQPMNITKTKIPMAKYVLAHTLLLLICQSC